MYPLPTGFELVTVSPMDHWVRSLFYVLFGSYFAVLSLKFLKSANPGVTILYHKANPFTSIKVVKGHLKSVPKGYVASFNGPLSTAFLGLLLFTAAQVLIVMMFKRIDYFF
jgi:hypothetical protein